MKKKRLTVCFSDITDFRKIMENFDDEQGVKILQEFFTDIGDVITKNNGKILKYIGDALLYTFKKPKDAIAAVKEISNIRKTIGELVIETHASAATGVVLITKIGHKSHKVTDIFGKTVNEAAILLRDAADNESNFALCPETLKHW